MCKFCEIYRLETPDYVYGRWHEMYASVQPSPIFENKDILEFVLFVEVDGNPYHTLTQVSKTELQDFPELFGMTWDWMVESLDDFITKKEKK